MRRIYNLTQHQATPEQIAQGVIDLEPEDREMLRQALTFEEIPSKDDMAERAGFIADQLVYWDAEAVMLGGAPYFMSFLEKVLREKHSKLAILYAFSKRESVDAPQPDGSVRKMAVFKHIGFVEV